MADEKLTYGAYLKIPELLSLQNALSDPPHHDETLFIIVHQSYELWFKQILHEVDNAIAHLDADRISEATRLLRRVVAIQHPLIQMVNVLETMRPQDFLGFRDHLQPASGFQSVQFRELEFTLGLKDGESWQAPGLRAPRAGAAAAPAGGAHGERRLRRAARPARPRAVVGDRAARAPPRRRRKRTGGWPRC